MGFIKWYTNKLVTRPIVTKCISSFVILGLGDVLCQYLNFHYFNKEEHVGQKFKLDYIRAIKQGSVGFIHSPVYHYQYSILFPRIFEGTRFGLAKCVLWDQTINTFFALFVFYVYLDLVNGESFSTALHHFEIKFKATIIDNWKVWPLVQAINFSLMPAEYRVFFVNIVGIFWNTYLSYIQNVVIKRIKKQREIEKEEKTNISNNLNQNSKSVQTVKTDLNNGKNL